jgi:hypothetical protein
MDPSPSRIAIASRGGDREPMGVALACAAAVEAAPALVCAVVSRTGKKEAGS